METTPEESSSKVGAAGFRCSNCSAPMHWSPDDRALSCGHCEHVDPVLPSSDKLTEIPVDQGLQIAPRGLGTARRILDCQECGARLSLDATVISKRCDYCGSARVVTRDDEDQRIRPQAVAPMALGEKTARRRFRRWLSRLRFRPNALRRVGRAELKGLYIPYWSFDARVHSEWDAQSGTYYYVQVPHTTVVNGKTQTTMRSERRIRWRPASGRRNDRYDDVLVCGSRSLPSRLVKRLDEFDTHRLVDYRPEYLAGFRAERYLVKLEDAHREARRTMVRSQDERCKRDIPGDTHRHFHSSHSWSGESFKHILLPIWLLGYDFKGKRYQVLINGQTGEVEGDAPLSWVKILLTTALVIAVIVALVFALSPPGTFR